MWRQIGRLFIKFIGIVLPVFGALSLYCALFPMWYMDGEYAMYRQQKDYVTENGDHNRVLIIGDSRAKAGFIPDELSGDCYNLALGGTTPIEGYYTLKEYLKNHPAPEYVVIAYAPKHLIVAEHFWTRTVYFHTMNMEDVREVFEIAGEHQNNKDILIDNYNLEYAMYRFYMPNKYCTALKNAGFVGRYEYNKLKYEQMISERGHNYFGTANGNSGANIEVRSYDDFISSDVITFYMQKLINLCEENNIQVVVEQLPINETSGKRMKNDFREHYCDYMLALANANPNVDFNSDFKIYPNEIFFFFFHLNQAGATVWCEDMKKCYPNIFYCRRNIKS